MSPYQHCLVGSAKNECSLEDETHEFLDFAIVSDVEAEVLGDVRVA
jgi:hypothetical protein